VPCVSRPSLASPVLAGLVTLAGCSSSGTTPGPGAVGFGDAGTVTYDGGSTLAGGPMTTFNPCAITVDAPTLLPRNHVAIGTPVAYDSNPPSSGPHYPIWAAYQEYSTPVDRRYYVHNEEHGTIVFLYNCAAADGGDCAGVVQTLESAMAALPDDALCTAANDGVRVRALITPDPLLDVPVAAAAWGWTYRAACADLGSLVSFALAHYGQGPEMICGNGTSQF
jgi:hypothetical protein